MKNHPKHFRIKPGESVKLERWPTRVAPFYKSKRHYQQLLAQHVHELARLHALMYAHGRYSVLVIFQGMDAAGKDGAVAHVMSGLNPQGCQVYSFKQPSSEELAHDFLWRTTCRLPERGHFGIFNRSYYEEVLIARVHPEVLAGQRLPGELMGKKDFWPGRYRSITDFEQHLHRNGTRVIKFFLHLSKQEQRRRFLARIDDPGKNWKFSMADMAERKRWADYQDAYEDCLRATSSDVAPWYMVPADDKENARLIMSQVLIEQLGNLKMSYPQVTEKRLKELKTIRKLLTI
jgi:PPK2 family polyphosphate:nucleotide phosphotransferase